MLRIDDYLIDVELSGDHTFENEATDFPVERGAALTDHVRELPEEVTIEGLVSDTPIGEVADARTAGALHSEEAYDFLKRLRKSRRLVSLNTARGRYDDMVMVRLSAPVSVGMGDALRFTGTFKHILLLENDRTTIRVAEPRGRKKEKKGNRAGVQVFRVSDSTEADAEEIRDSALSRGIKTHRVANPDLEPNQTTNDTLKKIRDDYPEGQFNLIKSHPQNLF